MSIVGKDSLFRNSVRWRRGCPSDSSGKLLISNNNMFKIEYDPTLPPTENSMARRLGPFPPYPLARAALSSTMVNSAIVSGEAIVISDRTGPPSAPVSASLDVSP